jgi:ABC-type multidrug transport system fused ATPase/permease subunit
VLITARRMRTVKNANKIAALPGGAAAGMGTPAGLMKQNGAFARMGRLQTGSRERILA